MENIKASIFVFCVCTTKFETDLILIDFDRMKLIFHMKLKSNIIELFQKRFIMQILVQTCHMHTGHTGLEVTFNSGARGMLAGTSAILTDTFNPLSVILPSNDI
jgi:hypothetical protein